MRTRNLRPMLFTTIKNYTREQLAGDITAGIIVAIIALPLSIALALASGVGPEKGLYTAIVAGFVISFLGGSTVQISGPTAAFATIVAGIVATHGMDGLIVATVMAGIILILMGIFKFGSLIKFIPYPIVTGFTSGIAMTIVIGQLKDFFGLKYADGVSPVETTEKLKAVVEYFGTVNAWAVLTGVVCLAILIVWPKVSKRIPGSLIAVVAGILMVKLGGIPVNTIGDLYTIDNSLPSFSMPRVDLNMINTMLPNAFTIAVLASIESLLSCVVADSMTNTRHRSDMELIAQGAGNIASAFFGGIPATGAIARTAANIKNGGKTPISGMVHAVTLVLILVLLMPYAALIPMPAIAAILFMVAYNMCQWRSFGHLVKTAPHSDVAVLLVKRMNEETEIHTWKYVDDVNDPDSINLRQVPLHVRVYEVSGPMFFGVAEQMADIRVKDFTKCLVLRMRSVPSLDVTALNVIERLYEKCQKNGIVMIFSHVNEQPMHVMQRAGFVEMVGEENFCAHIDDALKRAAEIK